MTNINLPEGELSVEECGEYLHHLADTDAIVFMTFLGMIAAADDDGVFFDNDSQEAYQINNYNNMLQAAITEEWLEVNPDYLPERLS